MSKKLTWDDICEDPVYRALDPRQPFMVARYLPPEMNPFVKYGIRVAALVPFTILPHIKTVATIGMLEWDFGHGDQPGYSRDNHTIVVDSSGNTAHAVARLARAFGYAEVKVVLSADVPDSKKGILAALSSVEIIEVAGGKSVAARAIEEAKRPGHYHLNQYAHPGNPDAHEQYTGPEIARALGSTPAVIAIAMGSAGTAMGVGNYFHRACPGLTQVIGVRPKLGEQVPGARDEKRMADVVTLSWAGSVNAVMEDIGRKQSFTCMRKLWRAVEPQPGPTSGLAWAGLEHYLRHRLHSYELQELRGRTVAFICPDDGRFYSDRTLGELDTDQGVA